MEFPADGVRLLKWNDSGTKLAACTGNKLMILNAEDGSAATVPVYHSRTITAVSWCGDDGNGSIATGDSGGTVVVYNLLSNKVQAKWTSKYGSVTAIGNSSPLPVAYSDGGVRTYSLTSTGMPGSLAVLPSPGNISSVEISGTTLHIIKNGNHIQYDLTEGTSKQVFSPTSRITARNGSVYGLENGTAVIVQNNKEIRLDPGTTAPIVSISTLLDGKVVGIASVQSATFWNALNGELIEFFTLPTEYLAITLRPNTKQVAAVSTGYKVILYDLSSVTGVDSNDIALYDARVFPNPATDLLVATVRIPTAGAVRLVLTDYLGRECTVVFDGTQSAANDTYTANIQALPTGVYYLVLTTPKGRETIPVTIVR